GVIPEIAAPAQVAEFWPVSDPALRQAEINLEDIDAIAVTAGPGLAGALVVGVSGAKSLAAATARPRVGIDHPIAHIAVGYHDSVGTALSRVKHLGALLVSGGHTEMLKIRSIASGVELLGSTIDDAAGEAYDKGARLIGAGYPGGPVIDKM